MLQGKPRHFLSKAETRRLPEAKSDPVRHTPVQPRCSQPSPAKNVPRQPPTKKVAIKTVLTRLDAPGISASAPLWPLSCWHCVPTSTRISAAISPAQVPPKINATPQPRSCMRAPVTQRRFTPKRGIILPMPEAAMAPAMPQSPSQPTASLPQKNGSPAR